MKLRKVSLVLVLLVVSTLISAFAVSSYAAGETGYYYGQLTDLEKSLYDFINASAMGANPTGSSSTTPWTVRIDLSSLNKTYDVTVVRSSASADDWSVAPEDSAVITQYSNEVNAAFGPALMALVYDEPELSWLVNTGFSIGTGMTTDRFSFYPGDLSAATKCHVQFALAIDPAYYAKAATTGNLEDFEAALADAIADIGTPATRYDTVKAINDYICNTVVYATGDLSPREYQTLYSSLIDSDHITVCAGYSKMFKALCDAYNIPCVLVSGIGNDEDHMWNYVKMDDGKWYAVDTTWADQITFITYDYFLKGSDFLYNSASSKHRADNEITDGVSFNYPTLSKEDYVNDHVHDGEVEYISNGDGTHTGKYSCCAETTAPEACSGGTATCSTKAICSICNGEYGSFNASNHTGSTQIVSNENGTHSETYLCCSAKGTPVDCSGGTATCSTKAKCSVCNAEYGSFNASNHTGSTQIVSNGNGTHSETYTCCSAKGAPVACSGGTATCSAKAKCSVCNEVYGDFASHTAEYNAVASGSKIDLNCKVCGQTQKTITMSAPADLVYNGTAKAVVLTSPVGALTVSYEDGNGNPVASVVNAGTYKAKVTYGCQTAVLSFTVTPKEIPSATLSATSGVYNGSAHSVTVTVGSLVENTDYTVTFPADMINSGEKTVKITGKGNYTGTAELKYVIEKKTPTASDFEFTAPSDLVYSGAEKAANIVAKPSASGVGSFSIKYYKGGSEISPVLPGEYTVKIVVSASENFKGATLEDSGWKFTVTKRDLTVTAKDQTASVGGDIDKTVENCTVEGLAAGHVLDSVTLVSSSTEVATTSGSVTPSNAVVKDGNGNDVTANYNIVYNAGNLTVKDHEHDYMFSTDGSVLTAECKNADGLCPKPVQTITLKVSEVVKYDGNVKVVTINGSIDKVSLPEIEYCCDGGCIEAGTHTASLTLSGKTITLSFTIEKAEISSITLSVDSPVAGNVPQASVTAGDGYSATIEWNCVGNFGYSTEYTATVTLTPDSNHKFADSLTVASWNVSANGDGSLKLTKTFPATEKIKIKSIGSISFESFANYFENVENAIETLPTKVSVTLADDSNADLTLEWDCASYDSTPNATNVFTWTAKNTEYDPNGISLTGDITVKNSDFLAVTHTGTDKNYTYNGDYDLSQLFTLDANSGEPTYEIVSGTGVGTVNGKMLNITAAGTFTVKVTTAPKGAYGSGEVTAVLTVEKGNVTFTAPTGLTCEIGSTLADLSIPADANGTFQWVDGSTALTTVGTADYEAIFTPSNTDLYNTSAVTLSVTVTKKILVLEDGSITASGTYGDKLSELTVNGVKVLCNGVEVLGSWILEGDTVPNVGDTTEYDVVFVPDENGDYYEPLSAQATVIIEKAEPTFTAPTAKDLTYSGESLVLADNGTAEGGLLKYSLTEDGIYGEEIPEGLNAGNYTVYYKVFGDENHKDSAVNSITVTVKKQSAPTVSVPKAEYVYTKENDGNTVDLKAYLPTDMGEFTITLDSVSSNVIKDGATVDANAVLTYGTKAVSAPESGSLNLTVVSQNYEDITVNVEVDLSLEKEYPEAVEEFLKELPDEVTEENYKQFIDKETAWNKLSDEEKADVNEALGANFEEMFFEAYKLYAIAFIGSYNEDLQSDDVTTYLRMHAKAIERIVYNSALSLKKNVNKVDVIVYDFIADETAPKLTGIKDGGTYCDSVTFKISEESPYSVIVNGSLATVKDGKVTLTAAKTKVLDSSKFDITVRDAVGNETTLKITVRTEHLFGNYVYDNNGNCVSGGTETARCIYCSETTTRNRFIFGLGHVYFTNNNDLYHWQECYRCGIKVSVSTHAESGWYTDIVATELMTGHRHTECIDCGWVMRTEEIPMLIPECKHPMTKVLGNLDPTCTSTGYSGDTVCSVCDAVLSAGKVIAATLHEHDEWKSVGEYHYLICKSEGKLVDNSFGTHVDADSNMKCDVCGSRVVISSDEKVENPETFDDSETTSQSVYAPLMAILGVMTVALIFTKKIFNRI